MDKKECFGNLEKVFPLQTDGLREVPPECFACPERVGCLRAAINSEEGIGMRAERLDQIPVRSIRGRLRRWSEKKELNRQRERHREKRRKWWR
jgi:hypothetical protein